MNKIKKIYSIEFDNRMFVDPLYIDTTAREILIEHNNKPNIKCISYCNTSNKCVYITSSNEPIKGLVNYKLQDGIYINFYKDKK